MLLLQLFRFEKLETLCFKQNVITDDILKILSQLKSLTKLIIDSKEMTTSGVLYLINKSSNKLSEIHVMHFHYLILILLFFRNIHFYNFIDFYF